MSPADLPAAKEVLRSAFPRGGTQTGRSEWELAEAFLDSEGYLPELCLIAAEAGRVIGYLALTRAAIGGEAGLALGPLGVMQKEQGQGVGTALVREGIRRAGAAGCPWIALLGGGYYARFGFESALAQGITVSDSALENEHLQILFLDPAVRGRVTGKLVYCGAFYDEAGNLI